LCDADLLGELKAADALPRRDQQIHGVNPLVQRDFGPLEDGAGANGEVGQASVAAVEAALAGADALGLVASRTDYSVRPAPRLEIGAGALGVGEHLEQFEGANGGLGHGLVHAQFLQSASGDFFDVAKRFVIAVTERSALQHRLQLRAMRKQRVDDCASLFAGKVNVMHHLISPSKPQGYPHDQKIST
jgi:hypothetical protein